MKHVGEEYRFTLLALQRYAKGHSFIKDLQIAISLFRKAIHGFQNEIGEEAKETLECEQELGYVLAQNKEYKESKALFDRILPIQKRLQGEVSYPYFRMLYMASASRFFDGAYRREGCEGIKESLRVLKRLFGEKNRGFLYQAIQEAYGSARDVVLDLETDWESTDEHRSPKYNEFEAVYPLRHAIEPEDSYSKLRRVKSAMGAMRDEASTSSRGWSDEDRKAVFRNLRGEKGLEQLFFKNPCRRCSGLIKFTTSAFFCAQTSCKENEADFYVLCLKCYDVGFRCLRRFEHDLQQARVGLECDICGSGIPDRYVWHCNVCSLGDFDVCFACYEKGIRCKDETHKLKKRSQPVLTTKDTYLCDECENEIEETELRRECQLCESPLGGYYDVCEPCWSNGKRCKNGSHSSSLLDQDGKVMKEVKEETGKEDSKNNIVTELLV